MSQEHTYQVPLVVLKDILRIHYAVQIAKTLQDEEPLFLRNAFFANEALERFNNMTEQLRGDSDTAQWEGCLGAVIRRLTNQEPNKWIDDVNWLIETSNHLKIKYNDRRDEIPDGQGFYQTMVERDEELGDMALAFAVLEPPNPRLVLLSKVWYQVAKHTEWYQRQPSFIKDILTGFGGHVVIKCS